MATRPVVANIIAITLNSENDRTLSTPETIRWPQFFALPSAKNCGHLIVSGVLNVLSFSLFSVIAMMFATTGRVAMLCYTMPIWAALFAWFVLGERLMRARIIALALCAVGMAILIYPVAQHGSPI